MVPNHATHHKCEIAGLGILKGAKEAVCGLQNIDLVNDTIKILGIHFVCDKKNSRRERLFNHCQKKFKRLSFYGLQGHLL